MVHASHPGFVRPARLVESAGCGIGESGGADAIALDGFWTGVGPAVFVAGRHGKLPFTNDT